MGVGVKKTVFIKNAIILTATSLILRFAGIIFKVWLAALIGSEGIGLYQLIFSIYVLVSTFATSGISTAVTRLVAEEIALGNKDGAEKVFKRAIQLTLVLALGALSGCGKKEDFRRYPSSRILKSFAFKSTLYGNVILSSRIFYCTMKCYTKCSNSTVRASIKNRFNICFC